MIIGIINPKTDGNVVFNNTGSASALVAYLQHEKDQQDQGIFFNRDRDQITAGEVQQTIDFNVKGLKKDDEKFYSLYIAPSEKELAYIKNNDQALKDYTRKVMENYARNFNFKDGRQLSSTDLKWFAAIHHDREVKNIDLIQENILSKKEKAAIEKLKSQNDPQSDLKIQKILERAEKRNMNRFDRELFRVGDLKPGSNKHIHIIVSARDARQKITLNPRTRKSRFSIRRFQEISAKDFNSMFRYKGKTIQDGFWKKYNERDKTYFDKKIEAVANQINPHIKAGIDPERLKEIGSKNSYSRAFFINLTKLKYKMLEGERLNDPYFFVAHGRDIKVKDYQKVIDQDVNLPVRNSKNLSNQAEYNHETNKATPVGSSLKKLGQAVRSMNQAIMVRETFFFEKEMEKFKRAMRNKFKDKGLERE